MSAKKEHAGLPFVRHEGERARLPARWIHNLWIYAPFRYTLPLHPSVTQPMDLCTLPLHPSVTQPMDLCTPSPHLCTRQSPPSALGRCCQGVAKVMRRCCQGDAKILPRCREGAAKVLRRCCEGAARHRFRCVGRYGETAETVAWKAAGYVDTRVSPLGLDVSERYLRRQEVGNSSDGGWASLGKMSQVGLEAATIGPCARHVGAGHGGARRGPAHHVGR